MKIIQVISSLGNGGAEKLVVELSNELAITNEVTIVSIKKVENWMFPPKKVEKNVRLFQLNKKKGLDFKVLLDLYKILKKEKPDVVHIHLTMPLYYFLILIPFFCKITFYHSIHNTFLPHKKLFVKLNLLPFYHNVINICLSQSIYNQFKYPFPKLQFRTIENGVKEMSISDDELSVKNEIKTLFVNTASKVILFVGRLSHQKNIPLLLDVFSEPCLSNTKLLIIGNGPADLIDQIHKVSTNVKGRIIFIGPKDNVADYMNNADALILTSRHEGLPIVILEALSLGLPVLSTPVGGVPDVITDGINGLLAKSMKKQDIVDIIEKFSHLNKREIDKMHESNIKLFYEQYSIKACAQKHLDLYQNETR